MSSSLHSVQSGDTSNTDMNGIYGTSNMTHSEYIGNARGQRITNPMAYSESNLHNMQSYSPHKYRPPPFHNTGCKFKISF